jgi:hypothetical protein
MDSLNFAGLTASINKTLKGGTVRYGVHPALTGVGAAIGAKLTSGAGAWGALADIVAAKGITTDFWICGLIYSTSDAAQIFEVDVQNAAGAHLFYDAIDPTAITINLSNTSIPYPIKMTANSQVQGRVGGAAAKSVYVNIQYATLL